jgi:hypothetical protein
MNKIASIFATTVLLLSGAAFADESATAPDMKPKGFVVIQRNIYVPVDSEGKMASGNAVVIDKQGFVTAEELEAAQHEEGGDVGKPDESGKPERPRARLGEGPMIAS